MAQGADAGYNLPLGLGLPEYRGGDLELINTCSGAAAIPGINCQNQSSFSFALTADATPGTIYEIDVSLGGFTSFVGSWAASVDPQVEIDPTFADASDFTLGFSPNVVPEPSSGSLLFISCLLLGAVLWFRSAGERRLCSGTVVVPAAAGSAGEPSLVIQDQGSQAKDVWSLVRVAGISSEKC